jgi:hypothetical protein
MEYPNLTEVESRSKRYWDVDGIPEIVMGGVWIVWGVAFLLRDFIPRDSRLAGLSSWIVLIALVVVCWPANWIIRTLKNKYTFPRGGYVKFSDPPRSQRLLSMAAAGLVAAAIAVLVGLSAKHQTLADLSVPVFGVLMAGGFLIVSRRQGMGHFVWFSLISLVLGAVLYPLKLQWMGMPWYFIGMGVPFAAMGIYRLRAYVRSVPLPGGDES